MSTLIKNLHIKNFKSVRDLKLDCDRINIFIGKPNAGKSNILEAISLFGADYSEERFMDEFIRYKNLVQLFPNFNFREPIQVVANDVKAEMTLETLTDKINFSISFIDIDEKALVERYVSEWHGKSEEIFVPRINMSAKRDGTITDISNRGNTFSPVKKYEFKPLGDYQDRGLFLYPPHGDNFYLIARSHEELRQEIRRFLKPNGLEFLLDEETRRVAIVHREENSLISFPMVLVPDTFQRYIFHLAAIMSNQDSVLLFEEPESHSYPPYIYQLAQHIIQDERNNQYFLTTHNPYLLTPILEETNDVALFVTWFEDYQTHARRLSEDEIREVLNDGLDVFLNLKHFVPA